MPTTDRLKITIQGTQMLHDIKKVLKEIKQERQRIEKLLKEATCHT